MRPVEEIEADLARVTAERDALARHIEQLIAPTTVREMDAVGDALWTDRQGGWFAEDGLRAALDAFLAERQRKGQFAALG